MAALQNIAIAAGNSGKLKTLLQVAAIAVLIVSNQNEQLARLAPWLLWAVVVVTLYSGVEYFVRFGRVVVQQPID